NGLEIANGVLDAAATATLTSVAAGTTAVAANAGSYTVLVSYQENGGTPVTNKAIQFDVADTDSWATIEAALQTALDNDTDLAGKVNSQLSTADGGASYSMQLVAANKGAQYSIRTEASSSTATTAILSFAQGDDRGVSDANLTFTTVTDQQGTLTAENIQIADATYSDMATLVTAFNTAIAAATYASATSDIKAVLDGTDKIQIQSVDEGSDYSIAHVTVGADTEELQNVLGFGGSDTLAASGVDAIINFNDYANTITSIKADDGGTQQTFTLETAALGDASRATLDIQYAEATQSGTETGINTGAMLLTATATKFSVQLNGGPATIATAGQDATIYNGDRTEHITVNYGLTSAGGNETISNTDQSLVFQIGGNVGQTANISLRNMAATALGTNNDGNMFANLSLIDVTTSAGAQDAQRLIDQAINEVSTTRGTLGSFQKNTLESNLRNLRVAAQNLTASESQIRDTDMAKEMSEFTKNQILMQAGTAMLAQANQVPQVVLSLFG
ncbi:MAG: flagellin, partial [candidate division Zixibacteria bacterium]|nr:flagellin [candidate division Zixibacteria bacterium]